MENRTSRFEALSVDKQRQMVRYVRHLALKDEVFVLDGDDIKMMASVFGIDIPETAGLMLDKDFQIHLGSERYKRIRRRNLRNLVKDTLETVK